MTPRGWHAGRRDLDVRDETGSEPRAAIGDGPRGERSLLPVALFAFGLAFIVFWYTPAFLYSHAGNDRQFLFPLIEVLPVLAIPLVLTVTALFVPSILMPQAARRLYAAFLAAATVYVWVQGFVLVQSYGQLDGDIVLPRYRSAPLVIGGACIIAAAIVLARVRPSRTLAVWAAVMVVLAGHLGVMLVADPKPVRSIAPTPSGSLYEFGSQNLLIILLDAFQSDVFADVLADRPEFAAALDGFTYYPNTLGVGRSTYSTLPVIHAGNLRPAGQSMDEHFNQSIAGRSFENELTDAGWKVTHLNPVGGVCPARIDYCLPFDAITTSTQKRLVVESADLLDLSTFRLAPAELKRAVYNDSRWRVKAAFKSVSVEEASDSILRDVATRARVVEGDKTVKFLHLMGTHAPATRHGDCSLLPTPIAPVTREAADDQGECALTRIASLIEKLKRIGVYHDMSIVLLADTGTRVLGSSRVTDETWTKRIGLANPLLAVKPPGAGGSLATNESQMSIADVRPMVCSLVQGCDGRSTNWESAKEDRPRFFLDYEWHDQFWHASTLKNEQLYEVRGPMIDPSSWMPIDGAALPELSKVTFGRDDRADLFGYGWGPIDGTGRHGSRWGLGGAASINLNLPDDLDTRLEFDVGTLPELSRQSLTLNVNGRPVGTARIRGLHNTVSFLVPGDLAGKEVDEIVLTFAQHRDGEGSDRHERLRGSLAVRFDELRLIYG